MYAKLQASRVERFWWALFCPLNPKTFPQFSDSLFYCSVIWYREDRQEGSLSLGKIPQNNFKISFHGGIVLQHTTHYFTNIRSAKILQCIDHIRCIVYLLESLPVPWTCLDINPWQYDFTNFSNVRETFDLVKLNTLELFKYDNFTKASCKNYGSSDQLTFIGYYSGSNHSSFYLESV